MELSWLKRWKKEKVDHLCFKFYKQSNQTGSILTREDKRCPAKNTRVNKTMSRLNWHPSAAASAYRTKVERQIRLRITFSRLYCLQDRGHTWDCLKKTWTYLMHYLARDVCEFSSNVYIVWLWYQTLALPVSVVFFAASVSPQLLAQFQTEAFPWWCPNLSYQMLKVEFVLKRSPILQMRPFLAAACYFHFGSLKTVLPAPFLSEWLPLGPQYADKNKSNQLNSPKRQVLTDILCSQHSHQPHS